MGIFDLLNPMTTITKLTSNLISPEPEKTIADITQPNLIAENPIVGTVGIGNVASSIITGQTIEQITAPIKPYIESQFYQETVAESGVQDIDLTPLKQWRYYVGQQTIQQAMDKNTVASSTKQPLNWYLIAGIGAVAVIGYGIVKK